jgi:microcin C transport system substrate-binding protein
MPYKTLIHAIVLFFSCCTLCSTVSAAPSMAMGYEVKYKPGFSHFDYVNPDAPKGGSLVLSGFGTFETLNPFLLKGLSAYGLGGFVFETLTEASLDEPFSQYGHLVEDIKLAKDKLSVTFLLDKNARFSDGTSVIADDVKFSFETLISDKSFPLYRFYYADVKDVEVLDQRSIRFNFRNVNAELHMILGQISVFSRKWVGDKSFDQVITDIPIGSGPYVVEGFEVGSYITYKRNPDYWAINKNTRKGMYNFDKITIKYYKDTGIAREALKAGEFDFYLENTSKSWATEYEGDRFQPGKIVTRKLPHSNNAGLQGFIFNLRREKFQDKRVRKAISLAFDFEWSNENLFYGQYTPVDSYYSNSELAAPALPSGRELALLEEFREQLPASVFKEKQAPVSTAPPKSIRKNLIQAKRLLDEAGWKLGKDSVLINDKGLRLEIDFMLAQKAFEKIIAPFAQNLKRLGIKMNYRTVDTSLFQRRVESFDFDMISSRIQQSQSPGNEQRDFFHSEVADVEGSRNRIGVREPVVDALIDKVIYAGDRTELVAATRALDRVLWDGNYVVPSWYIKYHRIAYWDKFGFPEILPLYYQATSYVQSTWWSNDAQ